MAGEMTRRVAGHPQVSKERMGFPVITLVYII
jgi:hypothetical protein